ncbi:MAG: hypothetical protein PHT84_06725, partial [Candidatus Pacebacteria bacterium]|nr:hypothetical protein [Candidatus Paceibacterota bacterium]
AIGKTTTYIDLIYNDLERKYIIAVPTNILKKQVYKDLSYKGFCDEEIFMTSSITDSNLIPEEVKENIARMHKIGIHNKTKNILLDYYKEIDENPSKVAIAEECMKIIEGVDAIKNQRVIVTTHAFLLNLPESFLKNYTIIIDEDILQLAFLNNTHSISENCLMSIIEQNIPVYSSIAREMLAEPLDVYKNIDKCKTNIQLNDDQLGDITFSENDNIFDLTKARTFVRIKDSDTKEIVLKYFCPRELASMKYIVLSATLNLNIYKKYFQDSMEVFLYPEMKAEYQGKLIQYTYHSLGRGDLANKKNVFDWLYDYAGCGELQVITFKGNRRLGNLSKMNKKGLHFGNTCGINAMTGMNIGIVGTPFKAEEAYKLIASYLGAEVNNKIDTFPRTHRVKYKGYSFLFITYSDPLLREIQLYSIESELEQCVGRARLLRKDCTVYLLSSFPCEQAELHIRDYLNEKSVGQRIG